MKGIGPILLLALVAVGCTISNADATTTTEATTTTTEAETVSTTTVSSTTTQPLGPGPTETVWFSSPPVAMDFEDPGFLVQAAIEGENTPDVSDRMQMMVLANLDDKSVLPYHYQSWIADNLVVSEQLSVRLGNADLLDVDWRYRWSDSNPCRVCEQNQVRWDNGWAVWTETHDDRGMILFHASHPAIPLDARIVFFPDPIAWPEADPLDNPELRTTADDAELMAGTILSSIFDDVPIP